MKKFPLHWQILTALILGILYGSFFGEYSWYVDWMGDVFLRALNMIIIPLVMSSMISGVTNVGTSENLGRLSLKTFAFYIITSLVAIITGLFAVNLVKPGIGADLGMTQEVNGIGSVEKPFSDILLEIIPTNIFSSLTNGQMLPIILFSILFGFFIIRSSEKSRVFLTNMFDSIFDVMMKITLFIITFAPFGVFGIVVRQISQTGDILHLASIMSIYMATVLGALLIHFFLTMPLIVWLLGKVNPLKHLKAVMTPLLTAFSTSSSNATLPLTLQAVEKNCGVSNKISSFTLPLGATINMNGTALYECVVVIFIAQAYGVELSVSQQILVVFTALLSAIGAAGVPMAGLIMMTIVLTAVGLPLEGIGLILSVDRILDMFRTATNVWGDTCAAVVIAKSEGEVLNV